MSDPVSLVGWYGKLPTLGDFASRRLPQHFIEPWDAWLQAAITASRDHLGENWLNIYLTSPVWRFALMPGACTPEAWAGVLLPSVDKVGRYFPLTFALQLDPLAAIFSAEAWYSALEQVALSTLSIDCSTEDLEQSLGKLEAPPASGECAPAQSLAAWWYSASGSSLEIDCTESLAALITETAQQGWVAAGYGKSIWWVKAEQSVAARIHCFAGLPPVSEFASLMQGEPLVVVA